MQMIEFTRPMAPHGVGDRRAVPDDIAKRLVDEEKVAKRVPSLFDQTGSRDRARPKSRNNRG